MSKWINSEECVGSIAQGFLALQIGENVIGATDAANWFFSTLQMTTATPSTTRAAQVDAETEAGEEDEGNRGEDANCQSSLFPRLACQMRPEGIHLTFSWNCWRQSILKFF